MQNYKYLINIRKRGNIMRKLRKILSAILVIVLCVQIIAPGTVAIGATPRVGDNVAMNASEGTAINSSVQSATLSTSELGSIETIEPEILSTSKGELSLIVEEVEESRSENTKHFRHADGSFTAALYSEPVHYLNSSGEWQNIDNSLTLNSKKKSVAGKSMYTPAASAFDIQVPQDFSNNQKLLIGKDGYTIGMGIKAVSNNNVVTMSEQPISFDLASVQAEIINNYNESSSNEEVATVASVDSNLSNITVAEANSQKMDLGNQVSAANYRNVFSGADLQYVITSSKIKENIIVKSKQTSYTYQFDMALDGLVPVAQDNGSIKLFKHADDAEPLFVIETPYMYDATEETSFAVSMTLIGNTLTVTADSEWINSDERVFPVVIDPTISYSGSSFQDATACHNLPLINFDTYKYIYAGNGLLSLRRTYMKFDLPILPDCSVVTNAVLKLRQHNTIFDPDGKFIYAFDLAGKDSWTESSITWSNQPLSTATNGPRDDGVKVIDYITAVDADNHTYELNLTKAVKNWYENNNNNGIMITSSDETKNGQPCFYSSDHSTSSNHPKVTINYNTNIGLEDYWSYQTVDMGRSGTAYVNNYNGNITYLHSDLNMTGNLLPINISHVYNVGNAVNYGAYYSGMYLGSNFHLNIQELLIKESSSKYNHYDSDGTLHHYVRNTNTGKITHEYDSTLELTVSDSGYIITDAKGNEKHFKTTGQLCKLVDANGNAQTFTFDTDVTKITAITDPVGRTATLEYENGWLTKITDPAGRVTSYNYKNIMLKNTKKWIVFLDKIIYPDAKVSQLVYCCERLEKEDCSCELLEKVIEPDNSFSIVSYSSHTKRVEEVEHYAVDGTEETLIYKTYFQYTKTDASGRSSGNTIVYPDYANQPDKYNLYFFDSYGRATSITNQDKQTQYTVYGDYSTENTNTYNKLFDSSDLQTISANLLSNHGFEGSGYWSVLQNVSGSYNYTSDESSNGYKSLAMSLTSDTGIIEIGQDIDAEDGETYTVSLDVKFDTPDNFVPTGNNGFIFGFVYEIDGEWKSSSSRWITSTADWERFSHTFTIPEGTLTNCHVFVELARVTGTVYVDSIQAEKSGGARFYNLVENSDFSNAPGATDMPTGTKPEAWEMMNVVEGIDGVQYAEDDFNGHRNYLYMTGTPTLDKTVYQEVPVNASAGDVLIIGGRAAAYASVDEYNINKFGIVVSLYDSANDKDPQDYEIPFDRMIDSEHQTKAAYIELAEDCHHILYSFEYHYHIDSVSFDDAFIYVGSYGEHYEYNDNGQIAKVDNDEGKTTKYYYPEEDNDSTNDNEVTKITEVVSGVEQTVAEYSYDDNHNVTTAKNNLGTRIEYVYNDNGQVITQTTITTDENGEEVTMTESFNYYQNGNYIRSYINEADEGVAYVYDNNAEGDNITKGLVTSVTDPNGNITTYTYDPYTDELLSTSGEAEYSVPITTSFTYENYLPKTIVRNGTTYSYEYDNQNRITSSKVGTQTLATNSYDSRQRLSQVTYANNAVYAPVYDSRDRLAGDSWNGTQISEYYYNDNDRLSKLVDNVTDISYQYDYAFYGLPFRVTGSDGTQTTYDYDRAGTLARLTFGDDNDIIYSGKYYTNEKGAPEDVVIDTLDNTLMHYNYDDFGRVESYSYGPVIRNIKYTEGSLNSVPTTNNRIAEITDENKNGDTLQNYYLEYNVDGSLHFSIENTDQEYYDYFYDGLGRVIENYANGDVYGYSYDDGGNLTSATCNYETLHTYTYGNANWKDQLTAFDGKAITYDANGNPISYDGYTYTWQRGTQLANITGNGKNIGYVYDSQGHRVQKTVNGVTTNYLYSGDLLMRQTDGTNTLDFQYDASGNMVGFKYNGIPYYYLRNLLNDVSGIVDKDGNVVAKYRYDAYGNTILATGTMAAINPIRYRGYYFDAETNWYYLNSRYYNPEWCRFISADCLFVAGDAITGSNMYAYCFDNPVMYRDDSGALPEAFNEFFDFIEEPVWCVSSVIAAGLKPITDTIVADISNDLLHRIVDDPSANFALTPVGIGLSAVLWLGSHTLLPLIPSSGEIFGYNTGLRHFMPVDMSFGAPWAGYFLSFEQDDSKKNYTSVEGKRMWQSLVGYTPIYDFFFSLGGPILREKYEFEVENSGLLSVLFKKTYYVVWIWKGDYWNLGAGAEIGIYYTHFKFYADRDFYDVDTDLTLDVDMTIKYDENILNNLVQTNWWVCSFTPEYQLIDIDLLDVFLKVRFTDPTLREPFYMQYVANKNTQLEWEEIDIITMPPYTDDNVNEYQFTVDY